MKFIQPLEISSKIMTLIEEAKEELILVSPYVEISKWDKMRNCLRRAINRKVKITFIARENASQDLSFLQQEGINLILIENLHAKVYLNEVYGIVTSQNITQGSDIRSIDIAYKTENDSQREELKEFINKYIANIEQMQESTMQVAETNAIINKGNSQYRQIKVIETVKNSSETESSKDNNTSNTDRLHTGQIFDLNTHFSRHYPISKIVMASTYIFSSHLLPSVEVMMSSEYKIKLFHLKDKKEDMVAEIDKIKFDFTHHFEITLYTKNEKYDYLVFTPKSTINSQNLIKDYLMITERILQSSKIQELASANSNKWMWQ